MDRDEVVARATSRGVQFIMEVIQGGLADYRSPAFYSDEAKRDHTPAVAAACRHCHIVGRAKRAMVEMTDLVKVRSRKGRITFVLADHTEIWFKKIDERGRPAFRPSDQANAYVKPPATQPRLGMVVPPEKVRWVAGYRSASPADTDYEVLVTGPESSGEWWEVKLSGAEVRELFSTPTIAPAAAEVIGQRVVLREGVKKSSGTEA